MSRGQCYLLNHDFTAAYEWFFSFDSKKESIDKKQQANHCYFQAVSRLGAFLELHVKTSKMKMEEMPLRISSLKRNDNRDSQEEKMPYLLDLEAQASLSYKSRDLDSFSQEINSILEQFKSAKQMLANDPGIDYAIKMFIPQLLRLHQTSIKHRTVCFETELARFTLLYSTKLLLTEHLTNADEKNSFISRSFLSNDVKQLKNVINEHNDDALFLSEKQIAQLYGQLQSYQYDKKYHNVFTQMERQIFLIDEGDTSGDFITLWRKFNDKITVDNVIALKSVFDRSLLHSLSSFIGELNKHQLLSEKIFPCLHTIAFPAAYEDYYKALKTIDEAITQSQVEHKSQLLDQLFRYTLDNIPHASVSNNLFNPYLKLIKKSSCAHSGEVDVTKVYLYLDLLQLFIQGTGKKLPLDKVAYLMQQVENLIGKHNFFELCKRVLNYKISSVDFVMLLNLSVQLNKTSTHDLLKLIDDHHNDVDFLRQQLHGIIARDYQKKFPERSLDEVAHDFLTRSPDVEFNIDITEFNELKDKYQRIKVIGDDLIALGEIGVAPILNECKSVLQKNPDDIEAQLKLLAIIRLQVKNNFDLNPYNVQMLNVLALLNQPKRIAQIKTGEGKSTLIAILAAYNAILGRKVDIITTSHDLSVRDTNKFNDFYRALGLKMGHNVNQGQGDNSNCYRNDVVYGAVSDFEFAYLRRETGQSNGRGERPYDVVIADEVDSMFIDMQRNEAILSQSTEAKHKPEMYHAIWKWISTTESKNQTKENLKAMLDANDTEVSLEQASTWLKSACTAQLYSEDQEYIIGYPEKKPRSVTNRWQREERVIKIVNKSHTGEVQSESTRWQGGLHELLEAKHKLTIHTESLTSASISHIEFFNKYKMLIGLTGTLGSKSCREELHKLYHVNTYDSPPYKPSRKKNLADVIVKDEQSQNKCIADTVKEMVQRGRPVLILCESIKKSKELHGSLSQEIKSIELYNGVQTESSEAILSLAGNPGAVTIATNVAGRGTDIVVIPEAEENGGLHVLVTFPAINRRVEQQAFGRTGRQGRQGTFQYVLSEEQLLVADTAGYSAEEKIQLMHKIREEHEKNISQRNLINYNLMHKLFLLQSVFFSLPEQVKSSIITQWATFKTSAHKYSSQFLHDELEDAEEDDVLQFVIQEFDNFWQNAIAPKGPRFQTSQCYIKSRLKQEFPDAYTKNLLVQALILFEDPQFDFSGELAGITFDTRAVALRMEEENVENIDGVSRLLQFYQPIPTLSPTGVDSELFEAKL